MKTQPHPSACPVSHDKDRQDRHLPFTPQHRVFPSGVQRHKVTQREQGKRACQLFSKSAQCIVSNEVVAIAVVVVGAKLGAQLNQVCPHLAQGANDREIS